MNGFETKWLPWMDDAVCANYPDLHYPPSSSNCTYERFAAKHSTQIKDAKEMCRHCPVRSPCLTLALQQDERYGIWGGTTPEERRQLRKERA